MEPQVSDILETCRVWQAELRFRSPSLGLPDRGLGFRV